MKTHDFLFTRTDREGGHVAVLRVSMDALNGLTRDEVIPRLMKALAHWVVNSTTGAAAWKGSCEDFNVGDLVDYVNNVDLQFELMAVGLYDLKVLTFAGPKLSFDYVLVDGQELEVMLEPRR